MNLSKFSKRRGFTLVELLVVIAIIGTLIGLLLPAVQSAREAARRTGCANNIRGLSQAVTVYESTRRRMPSVTDRNENTSLAGNWTSAGNAQATGYSWLFHILPYLEEGAMYNAVSANTGKFASGPFSVGFTPATAGQGGAWAAAGATSANPGAHASTIVVSSFICPSSSGGTSVEVTASGPTGGLSYSSEYGTFQGNAALNGGKVALANYNAMAGTHLVSGTIQSNGVIQFAPDQPVPTGLSAWLASRAGSQAAGVSDGMSKTVMIAETKERGYSSWIDGTVAWVVAYDPNLTPPILSNGRWFSAGTTPITQCALTVQPALLPSVVRYLPAANFGNRMAQGMAFGPSSDHQGGIMMHAFADTHVSQITADVDPTVYMSICSKSGNETARLEE